jgi:hypothetical protein
MEKLLLGIHVFLFVVKRNFFDKLLTEFFLFFVLELLGRLAPFLAVMIGLGFPLSVLHDLLVIFKHF